METPIVATSNGTLASLGHSLAAAGAATKAFIVVHPIGMAATGGALLGVIAYRSLSKRFAKKKELTTQETVTAVA